MPTKSFNYIFVDESGDPGKPFEIDASGEKVPGLVNQKSGPLHPGHALSVETDSRKLVALGYGLENIDRDRARPSKRHLYCSIHNRTLSTGGTPHPLCPSP